jgi:hypothetical protein
VCCWCCRQRSHHIVIENSSNGGSAAQFSGTGTGTLPSADYMQDVKEDALLHPKFGELLKSILNIDDGFVYAALLELLECLCDPKSYKHNAQHTLDTDIATTCTALKLHVAAMLVTEQYRSPVTVNSWY